MTKVDLSHASVTIDIMDEQKKKHAKFKFMDFIFFHSFSMYIQLSSM